MPRELSLLPKVRDAYTAIQRFMTEGGVTLKADEEKILNRWIYVDGLLKAKELDEDGMIKAIVANYHISEWTARTDISNTQKLFANARKVNKRYLIHHHLERMDKDIQYIRQRMFSKIKDDDGTEYEPSIDAKELAAYAKMMEAYTYALNSVPDETVADKQPPPIFQFILAPGQMLDKPLELDDAIRMADELIKNSDGVYETATDEE